MPIFVANFAAVKRCQNPVSIAVKTPAYFTGQSFTPLAPTWSMVQSYRDGIITDKEYTTQYYKLLLERKTDLKSIVEFFNNEVTFLCYESIGKFCHRYLLGYLIEKSLGIIVQEIDAKGDKLSLPYEKIFEWFKKEHWNGLK